MKMGLFKWMEKRVKRYSIWDFSALKTYCLLIGMVVGAYVAGFVKQYLWTFIAVILVLMARLLYVLFKK
jgi:hypothetical protein